MEETSRVSSQWSHPSGALLRWTVMQVWAWSLAGGSLAHSLAIMTDAAHLLTDFGSMMVSLFSLWVSSRPPTKSMNFGWHRSGEDVHSVPQVSPGVFRG